LCVEPEKADQPTVAAFRLDDTLVADSTRTEAGWVVDRGTLNLISCVHDWLKPQFYLKYRAARL